MKKEENELNAVPVKPKNESRGECKDQSFQDFLFK